MRCTFCGVRGSTPVPGPSSRVSAATRPASRSRRATTRRRSCSTRAPGSGARAASSATRRSTARSCSRICIGITCRACRSSRPRTATMPRWCSGNPHRATRSRARPGDVAAALPHRSRRTARQLEAPRHRARRSKSSRPTKCSRVKYGTRAAARSAIASPATGASFAYVPDAVDDNDDAIIDLAPDVDLFVRGAPFVTAEAERANAFGHGTVEHAVDVARRQSAPPRPHAPRAAAHRRRGRPHRGRGWCRRRTRGHDHRPLTPRAMRQRLRTTSVPAARSCRPRRSRPKMARTPQRSSTRRANRRILRSSATATRARRRDSGSGRPGIRWGDAVAPHDLGVHGELPECAPPDSRCPRRCTRC